MTDSDWDTTKGADFSMDAGDIDADELKPNNGQVDKKGMYHFEVSDVVDETDVQAGKTPAIRFDLLVMHSVPNQSPAGSILFHRIYMRSAKGGPPSEGSRKSAFKFGSALGLVMERNVDGKKVMVDFRSGKTNIPVDLWKLAKSCQFIGKIEMEQDNPQYAPQAKLSYGDSWSLDDPKVADVPKNTDAVAMFKEDLEKMAQTRKHWLDNPIGAAPPAAGGGAPGASTPPAPAPAPVSAPAGLDDAALADL
jgi:hypothetical protein